MPKRKQQTQGKTKKSKLTKVEIVININEELDMVPHALQLGVIQERIISFLSSEELFMIGYLCKEWSVLAQKELHLRGPYLNFGLGMYRSEDGGYAKWVRFYKQNNYVCSATCPFGADLHEVVQWLHITNPTNSQGRWEHKWEGWKCNVKFSTFSKGLQNKGELRKWGYCTPSTIILDSHSLINDHKSEGVVYKFINQTKEVIIWPDGNKSEREKREANEWLIKNEIHGPLKW